MTEAKSPWRWHCGTLVAYACLSWITLDHGASLSQNILGLRADPSAFIWFLAWWPWAIAHHLDPLYTNLIWQPFGVHLAWVASIPFMALLGLPVTLLAGPVLAFNILTLVAPVLGAWGAYFLCLHLTKQPMASAFGGYLFGFSSYEMAQTIDHLNLDWIVFVPCLALITLRRLDGSLRRMTAIILAVLILTAQFLTSVEVFATTLLFSVFLWLAALIWLAKRRRVLLALIPDGLLTALVVLALVSPVLWAMLASPRDVVPPLSWPKIFSADLCNLFIPTGITALGGAMASPISETFTGGLEEQGAYLGLPLILILVGFFLETRRTADGKFLLSAFAIVLLASLGAGLWVGGVFTGLVLPWRVFVHLPLVGSALPTRFTLYLSLLAGVSASLWLARHPNQKIVALVACLALFPAPHPVTARPDLAFFRPGRVAGVLGANSRVLVLPFAVNGQSSYWQQESDFAFRQTGGYVGFPPVNTQKYPAVLKLFFNQAPAGLSVQIASFCLATKTQYLIVAPGVLPAIAKAVSALGWSSRPVDDVLIYTVPDNDPKPAHG